MTEGDAGLFETIYNCRAMRRIKPDAVPDELLVRLVDAAIRAPSTGNGQHWRFVIVRDRSIIGRMAEPWQRGNAFFTEIALAAPPRPGEDLDRRRRILRAATYLARHLSDVPALVCVCVERDRVAEKAARRAATMRAVVRHLGLGQTLRLALAGRRNIERELWATAYPAVQNLLLAARALGLAAALTMPMVLAPPGTYERMIGLPKGVMLAAVVPVGYPEGRFGPVTRPPAESFISWDRYREQAEQSP